MAAFNASTKRSFKVCRGRWLASDDYLLTANHGRDPTTKPLSKSSSMTSLVDRELASPDFHTHSRAGTHSGSIEGIPRVGKVFVDGHLQQLTCHPIGCVFDALARFGFDGWALPPWWVQTVPLRYCAPPSGELRVETQESRHGHDCASINASTVTELTQVTNVTPGELRASGSGDVLPKR